MGVFNTSDSVSERSLSFGTDRANAAFDEILTQKWITPLDFVMVGSSVVTRPTYSSVLKGVAVVSVPTSSGLTATAAVNSMMYNGVIYPRIVYSGNVSSATDINLTYAVALGSIDSIIDNGAGQTVNITGPATQGNLIDYTFTNGVTVNGGSFLFGLSIQRASSDSYAGNLHIYLVQLLYKSNI